MTVYVFGNPDFDLDSPAITAAITLKEQMPQIKFNFIPIGNEIEFDSPRPIILDTVFAITRITVVSRLDQLVSPPRNTVHDFDLGFQLKYLKKIGRINGAIIIGLPMKSKISYLKIQSILRKLVEQDIQGS